MGGCGTCRSKAAGRRRRVRGRRGALRGPDDRPGDEWPPSRADRDVRPLGCSWPDLGWSRHLVALVAAGMAADPNRVPWGNMYEFTLAGTFVVAVIFLVPAAGSGWTGLARSSSPSC